MGCNCGKNKVIGQTAAALEEQMQRQELERRMHEETARAAELPRPLPRVIRESRRES